MVLGLFCVSHIWLSSENTAKLPDLRIGKFLIFALGFIFHIEFSATGTKKSWSANLLSAIACGKLYSFILCVEPAYL